MLLAKDKKKICDFLRGTCRGIKKKIHCKTCLKKS